MSHASTEAHTMEKAYSRRGNLFVRVVGFGTGRDIFEDVDLISG